MLTFAGKLLRRSVASLHYLQRRWYLFVALLLLLVGGGVFAGWRYAVGQWVEAEAAVREERRYDAKEKLDFCEKVWPNSIQVHLLAARNARQLGDIKSAENHLNRCLEINGQASEDVQREFLLLRTQAGEVDDLAPALFDLIQKNHPDSREMLNTVASAYIVRLRYKPAYACLNKWIEVEPEYARAYYLRAMVLERLDNHKSAFKDYQRALELDPKMVPARLRIAEMLLEDKQGPEALPHLEHLLGQVPDDPLVKARMGICLFLQGRAADARKYLNEAIVHLPEDAALLVTLANLDLQDGHPEQAERWLRQVLAKDNADTEALFVLVSVLQLQGRVEEATAALADYNQKKELVDKINTFLRGKAEDPSATAADYTEIGTRFLEIKRDKLGTYWLDKALEKDPEYDPAHRALADHHEKKGNAAAAAAHRRQFRPSKPAAPEPPTEKTPPGGK